MGRIRPRGGGRIPFYHPALRTGEGPLEGKIMENGDISILLIEDNPGDALLLHELLEDCPLRCRLSRTDRLSSALGLIREGAFDVVLMDMNLPDASGEEAVRQVMEAGSGLAVIIHSGTYPDTGDDYLNRLGVFACLVKGKYGMEDLCTTITAAVGRTRGGE